MMEHRKQKQETRITELISNLSAQDKTCPNTRLPRIYHSCHITENYQISLAYKFTADLNSSTCRNRLNY